MTTQDAKAARVNFNKDNYRKARKYAYMISRSYYKDLLHDAYLAWAEKGKGDLFNQPLGTIARTVRYVFMTQRQKHWFMYRGTWYRKIYLELNRPVVHKGEEDGELHEFFSYQEETPETILIEEDLRKHNEDKLKRLVAKDPYKIIQPLADGYVPAQVAQDNDISTQLINYRLKKLTPLVAQTYGKRFSAIDRRTGNALREV